MSIYYVYAYLREDGSPYYIGKGNGKRAHAKGKCRVTQPPNDETRIIFLHQNLTNQESLEMEKHYIKKIGRIDNGTGILRNMTDGGEGASGHGKKHSEETKEKIRQINLGKKLSEETKEKISNSLKDKKVPQRGRKGRIAWNKGRKYKNPNAIGRPAPNKNVSHTEETKRKMSLRAKEKAQKRVCCILCQKEFSLSYLNKHRSQCNEADN